MHDVGSDDARRTLLSEDLLIHSWSPLVSTEGCMDGQSTPPFVSSFMGIGEQGQEMGISLHLMPEVSLILSDPREFRCCPKGCKPEEVTLPEIYCTDKLSGLT